MLCRRLTALLAAFFVAAVAASAPAEPAAGDERGGWFVLPTPPLGSVIMHMPDDAPIGTVVRAAALGEQPRQLASSGGRLIMIFRPSAANADGSSIWPVRQVSRRAGGLYSGVEPLRPLVTAGEPIGLAIAGDSFAAMVRLPSGQHTLLAGSSQGWTQGGPLEGFQPRVPALTFAWGQHLAVWQGYGDGSGSIIWRRNPAIRADPPWSMSTFPPIPGAVSLFDCGGQLMGLTRPPEGGLSLMLVRAESAREVARIADHPSNQWIIPTGRGIAVVESDGKPLPRLSCRVYSTSGAVLYDGAARADSMIGGPDVLLLGLALASLFASILVFVFRPESSRRDSITLPAGTALAGPATRSSAGLIDASLSISASWLVWGWWGGDLLAAASPRGGQGWAILLSAIGFAVIVCSITEACTGRSPGKALTGCRVVSASGGRITVAQSVARNLVRFLCPPLGMAWMIQPPHRSTGLFGTVVVVDLGDGSEPGGGGSGGPGESGEDGDSGQSRG